MLHWLRSLGTLLAVAPALLRGLREILSLLRNNDAFRGGDPQAGGPQAPENAWEGQWRETDPAEETESPPGTEAKEALHIELARQNQILAQALSRFHRRLRSVTIITLLGFLLAAFSVCWIFLRTEPRPESPEANVQATQATQAAQAQPIEQP